MVNMKFNSISEPSSTYNTLVAIATFDDFFLLFGKILQFALFDILGIVPIDSFVFLY